MQSGLPLVQDLQSDPIVQTFPGTAAYQLQNQVFLAVDAHQKELDAQTTELKTFSQEDLPIAATGKCFAVQACSKTEQLSVKQRKRSFSGKKSHPHVHPVNSAHELVVAMSDTETLDSAYESTMEDYTNVDNDSDQSGGVVEEINPSTGSTEGGEKFIIVLHGPLPDNVTECLALFEECGHVTLEQTNPYNLTGLTPKSLSPGVKKVRLVTCTFANGFQEIGSTAFTYIDRKLQTLGQLINNKEMQSEFFEVLSKQMRNELSGLQTSNHFGETETGSSSLSESTSAWSIKFLKVLVYKAAQVGGQELLQTIFSTSAGGVVYASYKNSATLPEDVARANGHTALADYLQDVNNRLSKEINGDTRTERIDWLELKIAVDKEQNLPSAGTDDAQMLKNWQPPSCPESDHNESDYFADYEISSCSPQSQNEVSDSEHEDHSQSRKESGDEDKVNEKKNLPVENCDSSLFPLHHIGNQLEKIPFIKDANADECKQLDSDEVESHNSKDDMITKECKLAGSKNDSSLSPLYLIGNQVAVVRSFRDESADNHKKPDSDEVELHSSEDDINEKEQEGTGFKTDQNNLNENAIPGGSETENSTALESEVKSAIEGASTGTTSSQNAALPNISSQDTDDVVLTSGNENGLDGVQKEFKKIDDNKTTRSRGDYRGTLCDAKATISNLEPTFSKTIQTGISAREESSNSSSKRDLQSSNEHLPAGKSKFAEPGKEEKKLPQEHSSVLHHTESQAEFISSTKAENAIEHIQPVHDKVDSHSGEDDLNGENLSPSKIAVYKRVCSKTAQLSGGTESEHWNTFYSETKSTIGKALAETTSLHSVIRANISSHHETDGIVVTRGSGSGLDRGQQEFKKIGDNETNMRTEPRKEGWTMAHGPCQQEHSSLLPLNHTESHVESIPPTKAKNADYIQLVPDKVDSYSNKDDISEDLSEPNISVNKRACFKTLEISGSSEIEDWNTLKSEMKSTSEESSSVTTSAHDATQLSISGHGEEEEEQQQQVLEDQLHSKISSFCILPPNPLHDLANHDCVVAEITQQLKQLKSANESMLSRLYVSGNPRCGKSQLARLVAKRFFDEVQEIPRATSFVMTVNAESPDTLLESYVSFTRHLKCPEHAVTNILYSKKLNTDEKIANLKTLISSKVEYYTSWLLVVDNVTSLSLIHAHLPEPGSKQWAGGQLLITTQDTMSIPITRSFVGHISVSKVMKGHNASIVLAREPAARQKTYVRNSMQTLQDIKQSLRRLRSQSELQQPEAKRISPSGWNAEAVEHAKPARHGGHIPAPPKQRFVGQTCPVMQFRWKPVVASVAKSVQGISQNQRQYVNSTGGNLPPPLLHVKENLTLTGTSSTAENFQGGKKAATCTNIPARGPNAMSFNCVQSFDPTLQPTPACAPVQRGPIRCSDVSLSETTYSCNNVPLVSSQSPVPPKYLRYSWNTETSSNSGSTSDELSWSSSGYDSGPPSPCSDSSFTINGPTKVEMTLQSPLLDISVRNMDAQEERLPSTKDNDQMSESDVETLTAGQRLQQFRDKDSKLKKYSLAAREVYFERLLEILRKCTVEKEKRRVQLEEEMQKEKNINCFKRSKMDITMFEKINKIGTGAFGEVWLVRKIDTNMLYAMKILWKTEVLKRNQVAHVKAERDILAEADNEWVVKLYYSFQDDKFLYFVMDYIPGGDLMSLLINFEIFPEDLARFYIAELVLAIESVHRMGFVHRDIKPDNVLIDKEGHIKLTGFCLCTGHDSKFYEKDRHDRQPSLKTYSKHTWDLMELPPYDHLIQKSQLEMKSLEKQHFLKHVRSLAHDFEGTPDYTAPEVLQRSGYTYLCDWWSVGAIMYEMLVGHPPFLATTPADTKLKVINWETTLLVPKQSLSQEARDLILRFCTSPERRLGANGIDEIKQHPFFANVDWDYGVRRMQAPYRPQLAFPTDEEPAPVKT